MNLPKSSADPTQVSLTFQGVVSFLIPIGLIIAHRYGYNFTITEGDVAEATAIVASLVTAFGAARKLYYRIKDAN